MESKVILLLATFALFGSIQALPGLNVNDIYRLVGTIEPSTCACVIVPRCQIKIPYTSLIGINCNAGTDFCCAPRKRIKAFVTAKDLAELNAAAKRLKVQKNVQSLMQGVTPQQIDSTLEQLKEVEEDFSVLPSKPTYQNYQKQQRLKAPAPAPAPLPTPVPAVPEPEQPKAPENKSEEVPEKVAPVQDKCTCRPRNDCPENKRDFSFGKSCDLGQVRCCLTIENPDQPEDKEEVPTMVTKAPIPMKTQFKVATQPAKQKFFVYRVPTVAPKRMVNPEQLAKQVLSRPKPAYQPGQYYQPGQTKAPEFKSEEVGNRRANLGNQDMTAARAQYEENQRVAYENYQKHQRLMVQQEAWRRKNQPTFMEKVTDILDVRTWFG